MVADFCNMLELFSLYKSLRGMDKGKDPFWTFVTLFWMGYSTVGIGKLYSTMSH